MTSLIDVIFLLLLFFMLSSTFTRFAEVDLAAAGTGAAAAGDARPVFLQLFPGVARLNGQPYALDALGPALEARRPQLGDAVPVIVALRDAPNAQRLTDLLVVLRGVPGLSVTVLEER
jgi:biopolymer transport protein ExbD